MIHFIEHIFIHTVEDTIKLLPFLFGVFVVLEYIEHSFSHRTQAIIEGAGKAGPLLGGVLGAAPQCGFSIMATNLFSGRVATLGTLVAVYLSTSDEMLAIMISRQASPAAIAKILVIKTAIGIAAGFVVDIIIRPTDILHIEEMCREEHCDCNYSSPIASALKHTISIFAVIVAVTIVLNGIIELVGLEGVKTAVSNAGIFAPVLAAFLGLIPNCAASVVLTELYMAEVITFGTAIAGLLAGSGVAWVVLFRVNRNRKENFKILSIVVTVSIISGMLFNTLNIGF